MKLSFAKLLLGTGALISGLALAGCGTGGGYAEVDTDFYGAGYGGPIYYGHPGYRHDDFVAHPPERHWGGGRPAGGGGGHPAAAPHPSGGGGGGGRTTPEPTNRRG